MISVFTRILLFAAIIMLVNGCVVSGPSPLIVSVRSEDIAAVETLLEEGADVNAMSRDWIRNQHWKLTPLVRASISGNLEIMELLIEAGADINGVDEWGDTSLMAAVEFHHNEAARLLIENGADIDATKPDGTTALMIAARNGDLASTELLLRKGADPNIGLGSGDTALSLAAWSGNKDIVWDLIEYGAKADQLAFARNRGKAKNEIQAMLMLSNQGKTKNEIRTSLEKSQGIARQPEPFTIDAEKYNVNTEASGVSVFISDEANDAHKDYLKAKTHKAFAQSKSGAWGYVTNYTSIEHAIEGGLLRCKKLNWRSQDKTPCQIINVNDYWASELR